MSSDGNFFDLSAEDLAAAYKMEEEYDWVGADIFFDLSPEERDAYYGQAFDCAEEYWCKWKQIIWHPPRPEGRGFTGYWIRDIQLKGVLI